MGSIAGKRGGSGGKNAPPGCYLGYMSIDDKTAGQGAAKTVWAIIADLVMLIAAWFVYQIVRAIGWG